MIAWYTEQACICKSAYSVGIHCMYDHSCMPPPYTHALRLYYILVLP